MNKTLRAATLAIGTCALAGFSASASAQWTLTNDSGGDGSVALGGSGFTITGSDNGAPDNTTFYTETFASGGSFSFTWQYASLDSSDLSTYDPAGWLVTHNGTTVETQLSIDAATSSGSSITTTVSYAAGDTLGFYVFTTDSLGGPGLLAINEDLILPSPPPPPPPPPPSPPAIPEPQNAVLMMAGLAALFAAVRRRKSD